MPSDQLLDAPSYVQADFACIRDNESTDNPEAVNAESGDGGLYQFSASTWAAHGGLQYAELAQDAASWQQDNVAYWTWQADGWSDWVADDGPCGL